MFGRKSLYEEVGSSPQSYAPLAGLMAELKPIMGNTRGIFEVFRKRFQQFDTKSLERFIARYDGQVNVPEAVYMLQAAKEVYAKR
ncbi:hypothetical protein FJZ17_00745 [Candidatus Pacearchaeota archaeon]|nr:hypothetical protein [Candidatus Pacearchaeota archaeon]